MALDYVDEPRGRLVTFTMDELLARRMDRLASNPGRDLPLGTVRPLPQSTKELGRFGPYDRRN